MPSGQFTVVTVAPTSAAELGQIESAKLQIGAPAVVVVAEAEVVIDEVVELDDVVEPWLGPTAKLDDDEDVVELEIIPDVEELVEDKEVVVVVAETGLIETLELDVLDTEDEVVLKVDVLVVVPIIGLSMARPEVVVVETEDVLVVVTWTGPFDTEELADEVEVLDDTNICISPVFDCCGIVR
jgi:hypothetical protein